jgi:hypothetical protein
MTKKERFSSAGACRDLSCPKTSSAASANAEGAFARNDSGVLVRIKEIKPVANGNEDAAL